MVGITRVLVLVAVISFAAAKKSLYDFKLNDITGQPIKMADYKGKVKNSSMLTNNWICESLISLSKFSNKNSNL